MNWITIAIISYFLLAIVNIFEKIIRTQRGSSVLLLLNSIARFPFLLIPLLFHISNYDPTIILLAIFTGILSNIAFFPYLKALMKEEVSRLVPLWNFIPPLTLIMALIFLNEQLPNNFYYAFTLILIGSILLSIKDLKGGISTTAMFLMFLSSILYSLDSIILKYISGFLGFTDLLFYTGIGNLIFVLLLLSKKEARKDLLSLRQMKFAIIYLLILTFAVLLYLLSIQNIPISIFIVLGGFQSLFLAALAFIVHKHFIKIDEKTDLQSIIIKAISILVMIVGLYFLQG